MGRAVIVAKDGCVDFPLNAILRRKGVSQSELARRTGMACTYINRLARKRTNPNWKTVMVIAFALDLDVGDFHES